MYPNDLYQFMRVAVIHLYSKALDIDDNYYNALIQDYSIQDILDFLLDMYVNYERNCKCHK